MGSDSLLAFFEYPKGLDRFDCGRPGGMQHVAFDMPRAEFDAMVEHVGSCGCGAVSLRMCLSPGLRDRLPSQNRDRRLDRLSQHFEASFGVRWTHPRGGLYWAGRAISGACPGDGVRGAGGMRITIRSHQTNAAKLSDKRGPPLRRTARGNQNQEITVTYPQAIVIAAALFAGAIFVTNDVPTAQTQLTGPWQMAVVPTEKTWHGASTPRPVRWNGAWRLARRSVTICPCHNLVRHSPDDMTH